MGFGPSLNLDDFIEDYEPWLHGRSTKTGANFGSFGSSRESTIVLGHTIEPMLIGSGPETCSTVTDMVVRPEIIWDVNGYYRLLGADYKSNKKALREAFMKVDGHSSPAITNAFKQLLNPEIRQEYDAMPLGERYMNDPYIQQEVKQSAQKEASARQRDGEDVTTEDILNERGFGVDKGEEEPETPEIEITDEVEIQEEPDESFGSYAVDWDYAYYLWKSISIEDEPLARWQEMLHNEFVARRVKIHFAVGWRGGMDDQKWAIRKVGDVWVIFLSERVSLSGNAGKVTAAEAASHLLQLIQKQND